MIEIGVNPIAFSIGPIKVAWYGIMIAVAVVVLVLWTLREVKKGANLSYDTVLSAALVGIPSGVIFARLLHVIDRWSYYSQHPGQIVGGEGLTIYGAVLGARPPVYPLADKDRIPVLTGGLLMLSHNFPAESSYWFTTAPSFHERYLGITTVIEKAWKESLVSIMVFPSSGNVN